MGYLCELMINVCLASLSTIREDNHNVYHENYSQSCLCTKCLIGDCLGITIQIATAVSLFYDRQQMIEHILVQLENPINKPPWWLHQI